MVIKYGEPVRKEDKDLIWEDEKVELLYQYDKKRQAGSSGMGSQNILDKLIAAKKRAAEKAAKDL